MRYRNSNFLYYVNSLIQYAVPRFIFRIQLGSALLQQRHYDKESIEERVNYYNKIEKPFEISISSKKIRHFHKPKKGSRYYFDMIKHLRYFPSKFQFSYIFGDINYVPDEPSFVKSRPISDQNQNSILLKLDRIRHFIFVKDEKSFKEKKGQLVWRGGTDGREWRIKVLQQYQENPHFDMGKTDTWGDFLELYRQPLSIPEQLEFRYILSIEGNDVATNLKWILSSNSLCFMIPPKFETWFMEGKLIPNFHYVQLKADYSDMEEKLHYYNEHLDQAQTIIENAHKFIEQFKDNKKEKLISLMVINKYFQNLKPKPQVESQNA